MGSQSRNPKIPLASRWKMDCWGLRAGAGRPVPRLLPWPSWDMMSWAKTVAAKMERMEKLRSSSESQDLLMGGRGGKRTMPGLLPWTAYVLFKEWETRLGHRAVGRKSKGLSFGDFGCVKHEMSTIDKGGKGKKNIGCISWWLKEKCELEMHL